MKKYTYTLTITFIICLLVLSGCSSSKDPVVKKTSTGKSSTTVVVEKDGKEEKVTYDTPYVSNNRTITYDSSTDTTTITEGEVIVTLLGQWTDQGNCYTSERYGTVNLINRGELVSVSDFATEISSETDCDINKESHTLVINTIKNGVNCYNFHIHNQSSTYQFFYTTNVNTSVDDATQLIDGVFKSFTFAKSQTEEKIQPSQQTPSKNVQPSTPTTPGNQNQEATPAEK